MQSSDSSQTRKVGQHTAVCSMAIREKTPAASEAWTGQPRPRNFPASLDVILSVGGIYARLWVLPFPVLWIRVCPLFPAYAGRGAARKIRQGFDLSAQFLLRLEFDWMDRGPGLGMQE